MVMKLGQGNEARLGSATQEGSLTCPVHSLTNTHID